MAHTVQSFVDALRTDGVDAGRQAAETIRREAEEQSEQLVRDAQAKATKIVEAAEQQRQQMLDRTRTDLELAARDTVARLRDTLSQAIDRVLKQATAEALDDDDFLKDLIREMASQYAQSDATEKQTIELNVPPALQKKLADWAIQKCRQRDGEQQLSVELRGSLATAGFEYKLSGGTVEITADSVVQVLSQMVTPQLQKLIASGQQHQGS